MTEPLIQMQDAVLAPTPTAGPFNFTVGMGETWVLSGPTGSGITALIKAIVGLEPLAHGAIRLFGQNLAAINAQSLARLRNRIGVVFARDGLVDSWTVYDNITLAVRYHQLLSETQLTDRLAELGDRFALPQKCLALPCSALNQRERDSAALIRALMPSPELLLIDSDKPWYQSISRYHLRRVELLEKSVSSLILHGSLATLDLYRTNRVQAAVLSDGRIAATGGIEEIRHHPSQQVRDWLATELAST